MTDEDSTETPGTYPEYDSGVHSDMKAVVSEDWGANWTTASVLLITQRPERFASWSGLCRLRDDGLLCIFTDGPWGEVSYESVKCTRAKLVDALPIEDDFDHRGLEGTPFMWGLLGDWQTTTTANHGRVLEGAKSAFGDAMSFRGDTTWTAYFMQADVKITSPSTCAGLCLRVVQYGPWPSDYALYQCYVDTVQSKLGLRYHWRDSTYGWLWASPPAPYQDVPLTGFNPNIWHTIRAWVFGDQYVCDLFGPDGYWHFTVGYGYGNGMVGLRVTEGSALFDNVKVVAVP